MYLIFKNKESISDLKSINIVSNNITNIDYYSNNIIIDNNQIIIQINYSEIIENQILYIIYILNDNTSYILYTLNINNSKLQ